MKKNIKTIIGLIIVFIIGISTTVGAAAIFKSEDITYSSDKTDKTNVKDSLDELYSKVGKCPEDYVCASSAPISVVEVGDYISMTPTSTSYTLPNELSGCDGTEDTCIQNEIDPSELNLWRVIRKNEDGTVDVVSEYVSSKKVWFYGKTGYMNYVGALNTIAAQYTNEKYVESTRHIGYSNQIEICTTISGKDCPSNVGSEIDRELVGLAIGTLRVKDIGGTFVGYLISERHVSDVNYGYRYVAYWDGTTRGDHLLEGTTELSRGSFVRPILTLKYNLELASGDGKSAETAYSFE